MITHENKWINLRRSESLYRDWVGPKHHFDVSAIMQFFLGIYLGLNESHKMLDIGCGSLRSGRLFIPFLKKNNYYGIEPEKWVVEEAIKNDLGVDTMRIKNPNISNAKKLNP